MARVLKYIRDTVLLILGVVALNAVLEQIQPLVRWSRRLEEAPEPYLTLTIVMTVIGVLVFVGAMALFVLRGTRDMDKAMSSARARKKVKEQDDATAPALGIRESLRTGRWLRDPESFQLILALLGALVMALGMIGVFAVVMPLVGKVIVAVGVLYAIGRIGWAIWQA